MFFFCKEGTQEKSLLKSLSRVGKGIFFVDTTLISNTIKSGNIFLDPCVYWVSDFNTIYEAVLFKIRPHLLSIILPTFRQLKAKYAHTQLVSTLLHLGMARELEYDTQREVIDISKKLFKIMEMCETDKKRGFYKLFVGSQKKKVVFLSLLTSICFKGTQNKTIILLKNIDQALCATTLFVRTSLVIKILSFLELTISPVLVIIPCNTEIREEYEKMCKYIQADFTYI